MREPTGLYARRVQLRIVLAEDNYLVREGVGKLIGLEDDLEVVASCADYNSLLEAVESHTPEVVVTDIRMPPTGSDEGIRAANELRGRYPNMGVVVFSQYSEPAYALRFLENGSRGRAYLLKERVSDIGQLASAIREVAKGGSVIDPEVVDKLVTRGPRIRIHHCALTPGRSKSWGNGAGKNNAAVAASLVLSERAVEKHINSIFFKLGLTEEPDVHRRVKAVLLFLAAQN